MNYDLRLLRSEHQHQYIIISFFVKTQYLESGKTFIFVVIECFPLHVCKAMLEWQLGKFLPL